MSMPSGTAGRRSSLVAVSLCLAACSAAPAMPTNARFVHDVYFQLRDRSPAACAALVAACYAELAPIRGIEFLAAGMRDPELQRDVNDRDYDVSLHVYFADRAAHDAYQTDPAHVAFVQAHRDNWQAVRVFDSNLVAR